MDNVREKWKECRKTLTLDNRFILSCIVSAPNETPKYGVLDLADFQEEYYTIQELSSVLDTGVHIRGAEPNGTGISINAVDAISAIKDTFKYRLWMLNGCFFESRSGMLFKVDKNDVYLLDINTTRQEVVVPSFVTKIAIGYDCNHSITLGASEPILVENGWAYRDGSGILRTTTYITARSLIAQGKSLSELPFRSPFSKISKLKRVTWHCCRVHDLSLAFAFTNVPKLSSLVLDVWTVGDAPILLGAFDFMSRRNAYKCSKHFNTVNATREKCREYIEQYFEETEDGGWRRKALR